MKDNPAHCTFVRVEGEERLTILRRVRRVLRPLLRLVVYRLFPELPDPHHLEVRHLFPATDASTANHLLRRRGIIIVH